MIEGTTSSGFRYVYDERNLDDMRLVDLIAEIDAPDASPYVKARGASQLITMLLGPELKAALYDHIGQTNGGRVPQGELETALSEIMSGAGKDAEKNS